MLPIQELADYIHSYAEKEVVWGQDDCTAWAAKWVELRIGRSLNLTPYASQEQAYQLIERAGTLNDLWSAALAHNGIFPTHEGKCGDVAIIQLRGKQVGVIVCQGGICAWRANKGVCFIQPREFVNIWAIQ